MSEIARAYQPEHSRSRSVEKQIKGFNRKLEVDMIGRRLASGQDPIGDVYGDVSIWIEEYPLGGKIPVYHNPGDLDEEGNLINSITGLRLIDMTNPIERQGQVWQAVNKAGPTLKKAKKGDMVIIASPDGHSEDTKGQPIDYPDAYFFAFKKGETGIEEALTIGTDNTLLENQRFLESLEGISGVGRERINRGLTDYDQRCNMAGLVIPLPATAEKEWTFRDLVEKSVEIRKDTEHPMSDKLHQALINGIENSQEVAAIRDRASRIMAVYFGEFKQFLENNKSDWQNEFVQRRAEQELEKMLLNIAYDIDNEEEIPTFMRKSLNSTQRDRAYTFLGTLHGCNDEFGGGGMTWVDGPFGMRSAYYEEEKPQRTEFREGKYYLWVDSVGWMEGKKCPRPSCQAVTVCGPVCYKKNCGWQLP